MQILINCSIKQMSENILVKNKTTTYTQKKTHTWSSNVSSFSFSCSKNLSSPWALKMRSDSSEKRTASPSKATLSWDSDTSVIFSGMNMVAAAMPEYGQTFEASIRVSLMTHTVHKMSHQVTLPHLHWAIWCIITLPLHGWPKVNKTSRTTQRRFQEILILIFTSAILLQVWHWDAIKRKTRSLFSARK